MAKFIQYRTQKSLYDGPFDSVNGWVAAGMGYIIVTDNGKLIVIDGGHAHDAEDLVALLEKESGGNKPEIEFWIITHAHGDHYGAVKAISEDTTLASRISVKTLLYDFPLDFTNKAGEVGVLKEKNKRMEWTAQAFGAKIYHPKRDEKLNIDNTEIHFLFVPDDCSILNTGNGNPNHCSLIFTVSGAHKKVMITGDAFYREMQMVVWRYHKKLKCDMLQLPHHGLCDTGNLEFYEEVNAETILLPTCISGYSSMHSDMYTDRAKRTWNLWAENNAKTVYKACDGDVEIEI